MSEPLPISIFVNESLTQQFSQIRGLANKLEAQFNFQTMAANWYADEENITFTQLSIETPESYIKAQKKQKNSKEVLSDDVFYIEKNNPQQVLCYVALTSAELALLGQRHAALSALLPVKLHKVLNLIAGKYQLALI